MAFIQDITDYSWEIQFCAVLAVLVNLYETQAPRIGQLLLSVLAVFSSTTVPVGFLSDYLKEQHAIDFSLYLKGLVNHGILWLRPNGEYSIEPLVRAFLNARFQMPENLHNELLDAMHRHFITLINGDLEFFHLAKPFYPHLDAYYHYLIKLPSAATAVDKLRLAQLAADMGDYLYYISDYAEAYKQYDYTLQTYMTRLGPRDEKVFEAQYRIARIHCRCANFGEAEKMLVTLISAAKEMLPQEKQVLITAYQQTLGSVYFWQRRYGESLAIYQEVLVGREKYLDDKDDLLIALIHDDIGEVYLFQNFYHKALSHLTQARRIFEKKLGEQHKFLTSCYNKIGLAYQGLEQYEKAMGWHHQALVVTTVIFGANNQETAYAYFNLGQLKEKLGEYTDALSYYYRALTINIDVLGMSHIHTISIYHHIAAVYFKQGSYQASQTVFEKVVHWRTQTDGKDTISVAESRVMLARVYLVCSQYALALTEFEVADAIYNRAIDDGIINTASPDIISGKIAFGQYHAEMGSYKKAHQCFQQVLNIFEPLPPNILRQQRNEVFLALTELSYAEEFVDNAENYLSQCPDFEFHRHSEKIPTAYPVQKLTYATILYHLGRIRCAHYVYDEARDYLEKSHTLKKEILGEHYSEEGFVLNALGDIAVKQGDFEQGNHYYHDAIQLLQRAFNKRPHIAILMSYLGLYRANNESQMEAAAATYFQQFSKLQKELFQGKNPVYNVANRLHAADTLIAHHDYQRAIEEFNVCLNEFKEQQIIAPTLLIDCYLRLGRLYSSIGDFKKAKDSYSRAQEASKTAEQKINSCLSIGRFYYDFTYYTEAQHYLAEGLSLWETQPTAIKNTLVFQLMKAEGLLWLAKVLWEEKKYAQSLHHAQHALAVYQANKLLHASFVATELIDLYVLLGNCHDRISDEKRVACEWYQKALSLLQSPTADKEKEREILKKLGDLFLDNVHSHAEATSYLLALRENYIVHHESIKVRKALDRKLERVLKRFEQDAITHQNQFDFQASFNALKEAYRIQCILHSDTIPKSLEMKTRLDSLVKVLPKAVILKHLKEQIKEPCDVKHLYCLNWDDWKQWHARQQPGVIATLDYHTFATYPVDLSVVFKQTLSHQTIVLITAFDTVNFAITAIRRIEEQHICIHINPFNDPSLTTQQFNTIVPQCLSGSTQILHTLDSRHDYATLDAALGAELIRTLCLLEDSEFHAIGLWHHLLEQRSLVLRQSYIQSNMCFAEQAQQIHRLNTLLSVEIDNENQLFKKPYITNSPWKSVNIIFPNENMDQLYAKYQQRKLLAICFYGNVQGWLELARQICNVRFHAINTTILNPAQESQTSFPSHLQWLIDCENTGSFRLFLEQLLSQLQTNTAFELADIAFTTEELIEQVMQGIKRRILEGRVPGEEIRIHFSFIFTHVHNPQWVDYLSQQLKNLSDHEPNLQLTLLFLTENNVLPNDISDQAAFLKMVTWSEDDVTRCLKEMPDAKPLEETIDLDNLFSLAELDVLKKIALFIGKPFTAQTMYHFLTQFDTVSFAPDNEKSFLGSDAWDALLTKLIQKNIIQYDDSERGFLCNYYLPEIFQLKLLNTYFYLQAKDTYTWLAFSYDDVVTTYPTNYSLKTEQEYIHFITYLLRLIEQSQGVLVATDRALTQTRRILLIEHFIRNLRVILPKLAIPTINMEIEGEEIIRLLQATLVSIASTLHRIQLDFALKVHDFPTIDNLIKTYFKDDDRYLAKRIWALIKMGRGQQDEIQVLLQRMQQYVHTFSSVLEQLECTLVLGIHAWYSGDTIKLQSILLQHEAFNDKLYPDMANNLLWALLQSEITLLKLRSCRYFIDISSDVESKNKQMHYDEGQRCFETLIKNTHAHSQFQLPEIYLEYALLINALGRSLVSLFYFEKADEVTSKQYATINQYPVWPEICKQLSQEYCRQGNIQKAYNYSCLSGCHILLGLWRKSDLSYTSR